MEETVNVHFIDRVVDRMRKTADELEEFQVQANLGKMEALEKYDELKKTYAHYMHDLKLQTEHNVDRMQHLIGKIQDLQVQFSLGKADSKEVFEEQKKKILFAIHELQTTIKTNPTFIKSYAVLLDSLEKLKLKMEILSDKLDPVKEQLKESYSERKEQVEKIISSFKEKINDRSHFEDRMGNFQEELSIAYKHFKKAFIRS